MRVTIHRGSALKGRIPAPPSKSAAHRELICAGLADGTSTITNIAASEDILATMDCLRASGAEIRYDSDRMTAVIKGNDLTRRPEALMNCRESGSTMRFLIPLAALSVSQAVLTGSGRLLERPMSVYEDLFERQGIGFERSDTALTVNGRLKGGSFSIPGSISSQFVSGLMFALPLCSDDSVISITGEIQSRPYMDMTIRALAGHGVKVWWKGSDIIVPGRQKYLPADSSIEGDWSNAAYLMAAGADVTGLDPESLQGDKVCMRYFGMLNEGYSELDIADCPDLGPVLMAYAAMKNGCILRGTKRLRYKESDRGEAMREELAKFGISVSIAEDSIEVGCGPCTPAETLSGHNDHRIVMALSALCTSTGGTVDGAEAVRKSFPDYFERLEELGIKIKKEN